VRHNLPVFKKQYLLSHSFIFHLVPGPRRNPNVASLVHEFFGNEENDVDTMIAHRLDMDTSGVIVYARSKNVLKIMHDAFRSKSSLNYQGEQGIFKKYEALVCGHIYAAEGEIDLPLERDVNRPPFMRVSSSYNNDEVVDVSKYNESLHKHRGYLKMISKAPKESFTLFRVLAWEFVEDLPITRVELIPITGRYGI
jgi:23S rRNA-/tRNA-specific pseudouridylate synthase